MSGGIDTISVNGGPEVTIDTFKAAANHVIKKAHAEQFPGLEEFFNHVSGKEEEISIIREDITECFKSYCSSHATDETALKLAYKLFKALNKDKQKAEVMQFEYDKMADLLIKEPDQMPLFGDP